VVIHGDQRWGVNFTEAHPGSPGGRVGPREWGVPHARLGDLYELLRPRRLAADAESLVGEEARSGKAHRAETGDNPPHLGAEASASVRRSCRPGERSGPPPERTSLSNVPGTCSSTISGRPPLTARLTSSTWGTGTYATAVAITATSTAGSPPPRRTTTCPSLNVRRHV
jgi:hypothetical protein